MFGGNKSYMVWRCFVKEKESSFCKADYSQMGKKTKAQTKMDIENCKFCEKLNLWKGILCVVRNK